MQCSFCQNWSISQAVPDTGEPYTAAQIVDAAVRSGSPAIAYTYNEPLISIEFIMDCASLARKAGLFNVAVTNGYVNQAAGVAVIEVMDAFNVDIKSIEDDFYRRNCHGTLPPVLAFCCMVKESGKHIEVTNLIIPGENDDTKELDALAEWVSNNLGRNVPLHLSAYRPQYKMKNPATDVVALHAGHDAAQCHLDYVYIGNALTEHGQDTICPKCASTIVTRRGYSTLVTGVEGGSCACCGLKLTGFCW